MEMVIRTPHRTDLDAGPPDRWPSWWRPENDSAWDRAKAALRRRGPERPESVPFEIEEPALRYGFGAASHYTLHAVWNDALEARLRQEWTEQKGSRDWDDVRGDVQRGWESARSPGNKDTAPMIDFSAVTLVL